MKDADVDKLTRREIEEYLGMLDGADMILDVEQTFMKRLCDAALSSLSQEAVRDEAWLIERGEAPWIEYWGGEHIRLWTKDVYKAVWFPTELAAKTVGWEMRVHPGTGSETRVIQHGFAALKREPNAAAPELEVETKFSMKKSGPKYEFDIEGWPKSRMCSDPQECQRANRCLEIPPCGKFEATTGASDD